MAEQQQRQPLRAVDDLDRNRFCCSVCLELLKEAVTIPCGHSYCKSCIESCWDQEEKKGEYSCPQCRETFNPRPAVRRNNMLAEVVERLKKSNTQQAPPPAAEACGGPGDGACGGPGDVACDFCCGTTQNKATMSCLVCLASYCPAHLEPHYSVPVLKNHQLVSVTIPLQEKMCRKHNKLMEVYCETDKECICYLCVIDEHKEHTTVSLAAERVKEQKQLTTTQNEVQERIQQREKELNELLQVLQDFKSCSCLAVENCDKIFDQLISSINKKRTLLKQLIETHEETTVAQAREPQLQLEEEIAKLRRRDTELDQLSHTDDHIHFIRTFQSLSTCSESPNSPFLPVVFHQRSTSKPVTDCVSKLSDDVEGLLKDTWPGISAAVSSIDIVPSTPKTREEYLNFCRPLQLDVNTVSRYFSISQEYRRVTGQYNPNNYCVDYGYNYVHSHTPVVMQVLCSEGLSERCYWEVTLSRLPWSVAMSYKGRTAGKFGNDNKSWSLFCSSSGYGFRHNNTSKKVSGPRSSRIGVYLDYEAGTLSFHCVSGTMTLLHEEQAKFTQPLYPGLELVNHASQGTSGHYAELTKLW